MSIQRRKYNEKEFVLSTISPLSFQKAIYNCIPNYLIPPNWTCKFKNPIDNVKSLLSESNGLLKICGDAYDVLNTITEYKKFPGSHHLFGFDDEDLFKNSIIIYPNLRNNKNFIYKSEAFHVLRSISTIPKELTIGKLFEEIIVLHLKCFQSQMGNNWEMMEYPQDDLNEMARNIRKYNLSSNVYMKPENLIDLKSIIQRFMGLMPVLKLELPGEDVLLEILNKYTETLPFKQNEKDYGRVFDALIYVIIYFYKFYKESVEMEDTQDKTPIVRIFSAGKNHYFMVQEVAKALKDTKQIDDRRKFEDMLQNCSRLGALDFTCLSSFYDKEALKNVEFVRMHNYNNYIATPLIPTVDGGYCIQVENFCFQLFTDMIAFKKVFQIITPDQWSLIKKFLKPIHKKFAYRRLMSFEDSNFLKKEWNDFFDIHFKKQSIERPPKEARCVTKRREFTAENLKKELKYLNLDSVFPNILDKSSEGYEQTIMCSPRTTPDIFTGVHWCQLICMENIWQNFVPNDNEDVEDTGGNSDDVDEITESTENPLKPSTSKRASVPNDGGVQAALEETTKGLSEVVVNQKRKNQKLKKQKSLENSEVEVVRSKESNSCPKCFNSSQFRRKTEEKLKLSKIENKQLKKEIDKQNEMIEMLKLQLEEKEKLIQKMIEEKEEMAKKKAPAAPIIDFSDDSKDALYAILSIRNTIQKENPLKKAEEITKKLSTSSKKQEIQKTARIEFREFEKKCKFYIKTVEQQVNHVLSQSNIPSNWTPSLPEFPQFSKEFHEAFWKTLSLEVPKICESLSKEIELEDCSICLNDINLYHDIINCDCCRKNFHVKCANDWFKIQRNCPQCRRGMLDPIEFPKL